MKRLLLPLIAILAFPIQVSANNLSLPNCNFLLRVNCIKEETDNDGKYVGQINMEAKRHGQGTYDWNDGRKYVGEWKDGERTGQGTLSWANGDKYVGQFLNGKRTGQGTYYWADGSSWTGEFLNGEFTNNGSYN